MNSTDSLSLDSGVHKKFALRLGRAALLLGLGVIIHLPSTGVFGLLPPAVSPRPFVRVAAQQADSSDAPAVMIAHSLVYAGRSRSDAVLEANAGPANSGVGTAGIDNPPRAVALADVELAASHLSSAVTGETRSGGVEPTAVPETPPLPPAAPPAIALSSTPPQAFAASVVKMAPPLVPVRPAAAAAHTVSEEELVRRLLDEYTGAFERRDVRATKALYPTVDGKALARAYEQITSQRLTLNSCGITISGSTANARCRGSATFQPRIGTRPVQIASREWTFDLSKQDTSWRIVNTDVR
jgi:hypothetical protein